MPICTKLRKKNFPEKEVITKWITQKLLFESEDIWRNEKLDSWFKINTTFELLHFCCKSFQLERTSEMDFKLFNELRKFMLVDLAKLEDNHGSSNEKHHLLQDKDTQKIDSRDHLMAVENVNKAFANGGVFF